MFQFQSHELKVVLCWVPGHTGVRGNEHADIAARQINPENPSLSELPVSDLKPIIRSCINKAREQEWFDTQITNYEVFVIRFSYGDRPTDVQNVMKPL